MQERGLYLFFVFLLCIKDLTLITSLRVNFNTAKQNKMNLYVKIVYNT